PALAVAKPGSEDKPLCRRARKAWIGAGLLVATAATVVVVVVVVVKGLPRPDPPEWSAQGSTPHLADIVLGRCFGYTQLLRPELRDKDCQKIWDAFKNAFISKSPCNITEDDYQPLLKLANQTLPCNKTLLWSKTNVLAHQYSRVQGDMLTLEDTLLGYLADGLMWCGDASSSEINYKSCPDWRKDCSNNPQSVFWKTISQSFAEAACGMVHVMLNGSISKAFDKNSILGSVEILHLNPEKVHTLQVWVMHSVGGISSDSCSGSSVNELKMIINKRNIAFVCQDDYRPAKFVQCVKNHEHSSCRSVV
ncbi:ADP-ribosyl cyclase/cyclic ADP-ribose hydrolase 1, partial [Tupaia chinensis]|uniref:ADP-ribosyl cyclase/cyclic ADP-ribose hydrolase 1 n=1 Tax=Tupaia chinensis TaxID=246437 RepID=UPI000FFB91FF